MSNSQLKNISKEKKLRGRSFKNCRYNLYKPCKHEVQFMGGLRFQEIMQVIYFNAFLIFIWLFYYCPGVNILIGRWDLEVWASKPNFGQKELKY